MQETSTTYTNQPMKGLITDLNESLVSKEFWTFARNAQMNSHLGQVQFLQNEPSNYKCVDLPYTPIGFIRLLNNRWVVFTTDNTNSEIGVFNELECTYQTIINNTCLGFNTEYLVQGVSKENFDCTESVYWTDALNPRRRLNLQEIPYTYSTDDDACETKIFTDQLDCENLMIDKLVSVPCLESKLSVGGSLKNGTYQFAIAYAVNRQRVSDYYSITRPQRVWSHQNKGQAIDLQISDLDRDFEEYELVAIYSVEDATFYKSLGFYSTARNSHHITNVERPEYTEISLLEIMTKYPRYSHADIVSANDRYLLWGGVRTSAEIDYQLDAMNIETEYVVYEVPQNYYAKGGQLVGYCRDESYSFGIQWLNSNGEWSATYHIPGRRGNAERKFASGQNVYELRSSTCDNVKPQKWLVENTAGGMLAEKNIEQCEEKIIGYGRMAYMETTESYPDNIKLFGKDSCTPIRHHKFPDNCHTHIYGEKGNTLNILGIRFKNIAHPKDKNGNELKNIVGYRIVRGAREGNRTIIAKGICTNIRSYQEDEQTVFYPNYPYNDLRPDRFLSTKLPYVKGSSERDFRALNRYENDKFSFYSPHTLFSNVGLGEEINFVTEEHATVSGRFSEPWKHPKQKLLTEFDIYFALVIGAIDGYLSTRGKRCYTKVKRTDPTGLLRADIEFNLGASGTLPPIAVAGTGGGATVATPISLTAGGFKLMDHRVLEETCDSIVTGLNDPSITAAPERILVKALTTLAKVGMFAYFGLNTARETLDIIYNFSGWQQYALQYTSHGLFNEYECFDKESRRRRIEYYQYTYDGINTVEGNTLNNYKRANSVYLRLNDDIENPKFEDNSRNTISDLGICGNPFQKVTTNASVYYTSIKRKVPNQYGQIDSVEYLDTGHCVHKLEKNKDGFYESGAIFGGDTFINKFAIRDTFNFFSQSLYDLPDGTMYDYSVYRNVAYPRFWMDSTPYDLSEIFVPKPKKSNLPKNKYNLDCAGNNKFSNITVVKNRYFYLHNSSVKEFFVESDFNLDYRDWSGDKPTFYSRYNQDLNTMFRHGEGINDEEEFLYDQTLSKQLLENNISAQRPDFDPNIDETCYQYMKNRVIYSMPAFKEQKGDSWQINLVNNYYDFPLAEFGSLTAMQGIDNEQIMFLFDKASPYVTPGRDELQLDGSGTKITLGDGGLFAREPRPIVYTDYAYGNSQSKWAFNNTQFGTFFPSQRQGRLFNYNGKLEEISRNGMHWWFKEYLPSKLLQQFPDFKHTDNLVEGVGLTSIFDNTEERYYLIKKDYVAKDPSLVTLKDGEFRDLSRVQIIRESQEALGWTFDRVENGTIYFTRLVLIEGEPVTQYNSIDLPTVNVRNTDLFENASWTLSYSPKDQSFVSWHDWHPEWALQTEKHFLTVKDNGIWKHNNRTDSFCNFYNTQYPFSLEYLVNNGQQVQILKSLEYYLEVGKYFNQGRDFHQILDQNFDWLRVSNQEQISANLRLNLAAKNDISAIFNYPKIDKANGVIDILFNKEEQKYRVNQFWDITNDRGEFTNLDYPLLLTMANGYIKNINQEAVNYEKPDYERKKFRNIWHKVMLTKEDPGDMKFIFKWANNKEQISFR